MIRIGAVGDIHLGADNRGSLRPGLGDIDDHADVLLLAGDLTHVGTREEAEVVADELAEVAVPIVAVLGNHDFHSDQEQEVTKILEEQGVTVLEGSGTVIETEGGRLGVAGVKGFGGGFPPAMAACFGEPEMKAFVSHGDAAAAALQEALESLDSDVRVALSHYSPSPHTLEGERPEIHPFLGSIALAEAVDTGRADVAIHGHAHVGAVRGSTPGGVPVWNVAQPLLDKPYTVIPLAVESSPSGL